MTGLRHGRPPRTVAPPVCCPLRLSFATKRFGARTGQHRSPQGTWHPPFSALIIGGSVAGGYGLRTESGGPGLIGEKPNLARVSNDEEAYSTSCGALVADHAESDARADSAHHIREHVSKGGRQCLQVIGGIPPSSHVGILVCNPFRSRIFCELTRRMAATYKQDFTSAARRPPVPAPDFGGEWWGRAAESR